MFWTRLLLLLLACSFSSLCKCFFISKTYNTIVITEVEVKTSCDGPSSLKIQTSVLHLLKARDIVHLTHFKKYSLYCTYL